MIVKENDFRPKNRPKYFDDSGCTKEQLETRIRRCNTFTFIDDDNINFEIMILERNKLKLLFIPNLVQVWQNLVVEIYFKKDNQICKVPFFLIKEILNELQRSVLISFI